MPRLLQSSVSLIAIYAAIAFGQSAVETVVDTSAVAEDEVDELVRELRDSRATRVVVDRSIDVYSTHYAIGPQVFSSLDDLLDYIEPYPPDRFPMVSLRECSARARAEELLAAKAEIDRAYLQQLREAGLSRLYQAMVSSPRECAWNLSERAAAAVRAAERGSQ